MANKNEITGFVPTYPSSILEELETEFMDEDIWNTYKNTISFLNNVYIDSNERIKCKPKLKIIEDGLIVGILTNANQFIAINPPIEDLVEDELVSIKDNNYIIADTKIQTSDKKDNKREKLVKNIKLEHDFYNIFRNQVRIILGEFKNQRNRKRS